MKLCCRITQRDFPHMQDYWGRLFCVVCECVIGDEEE